MNRGRRFKQYSSQQAVRFYVGERDPTRVAHEDYFRQLYPWMLIQDTSVSIMPIGGRTANRPFRVFATPPDPRAEELISAALPRGGDRHDLGRAVCAFFRDCAQAVMSFGEVYYEIVYFSDNEASAPVRCELTMIQSGTVKRRWGHLIQYVPQTIANERSLPVRIQLPEERVVLFSLPTSVGVKLKRTMKALVIASRRVFPKFVLERTADESSSMPFDVTTYDRARKAAIAEATRSIGWNARGLLRDEALEYYWLYRQLSFEGFIIDLRNQILNTLNEAIQRIGRRLGFSVQLHVEGLPGLQELEAARAALKSGNGTFKEILDPFMGY